MGEQARTVNGFTKISAAEKAWLEEAYGSSGKGLRAALELLKAQQQRGGLPTYNKAAERAVRVKKVRAAPVPRPVVPVDEEGTPIPCRIHREFEAIAEYYEKGVAMREKRCIKCGHVVVERAG